MSKYFAFILFIFSPVILRAQAPVDTTNIYIDTTQQKDLIDVGSRLLKLKWRRYPEKEQKEVYFSILPLSTNVPGTSKALVTSTSAGFFLGPRSTTYISQFTFAPYFNFKGRYGLPIHSSIWLPNNTYNLQGDTRFLVYPEATWGLGGGQNAAQNILVNYDYIRLYHTLLKRITPFLYAGAGYDADYYININTGNNISLQSFTGYPYGTAEHSNSFSSGITFNGLYDSRQNIFNPIPGAYADVIYRYNAHALGSDNGSQSVYIDLRKYISLWGVSLKNQLVFWFYYWSTIGSGTPYFNLPAIGMDPYQRSGRGIAQNRYRGQELAYFETEYRRDLTINGLLGFVLFTNVNSATQGDSRSFRYLNPAAGGGLRVKFNKKSGTNICIDYGLSKDFSDMTIALGEAF